ncbi:MAG: BlaI/MecI/CopY family transcriptional regulator [Acidobacteria bacterium]|nr:BlaI/MecI/CopY family transcriptional regulator [Acidobacteriota bacterium]
MKRRGSSSRKTFFDLPPLELECMKALWAQGEASVRDIRAHINGSNGRALAYTTIETIMDRLTRKGAVVRRKVGRAHLYTPQYQAAAARADAVGALVHHFFGGSRRALAAFLAGEPLPEPTPRPAPRAIARPVSTPLTTTRRVPAATRKAPAAGKAQPPSAERRLDTSLL